VERAPYESEGFFIYQKPRSHIRDFLIYVGGIYRDGYLDVDFVWQRNKYANQYVESDDRWSSSKQFWSFTKNKFVL
jgi:hypothetical protein